MRPELIISINANVPMARSCTSIESPKLVTWITGPACRLTTGFASGLATDETFARQLLVYGGNPNGHPPRS
jgi:hypothetical protein